MDKMVAADGQCIAVPHRNNQIQFRPAHFYAGRKSQGTTVNRMQCVKIDVAANAGRTADTGNHDDVVFFDTQRFNGP